MIVFTLSAGAQQRDENPYRSPQDAVEGRRLYRFYCVNCHGMDGASGRGARLASPLRRHGSSDREMFRTIANGIPGTEMPGLWMDEDTVWKILAFVRTLEKPSAVACEDMPGDAGRGRELYTRHACARCHTLGMSGGRLGPDLTGIGAARSRDQLRESILDPAREVAKRYRTVAANTPGGHVEGILLREDDYTVHLMDAREEIRSFSRKDLRRVERPPRSLMPSYRGALAPADLDDLLSFLCAQRSAGGRP